MALAALPFAANSQVIDTANQKRVAAYRQLYWSNIPKAIDWVSDFEKLYTKKEARALDSIISGFEKQTTIEIAIVTLDSFCTSKENLNALTQRIFNTWGIGKKDKNNGILISISEGHGIIRIDNGEGIRKMITDEETKGIIDKYFIPNFRNGDDYAGTVNGVTALMALLKTRIKK